MYGTAWGPPGVQEHAATGPVMYLYARTRLGSECSMQKTPDRLKRKRTAAPQAAKNAALVEKYL